MWESTNVPERKLRRGNGIVDALTAADVSDLSGVIEVHQPTLWVHGHVHHSSDYLIGETRIISNPHGYGAENPHFNPALVVEVPA
jgi:Icc-related predicted phosphoesterase